MKTDIVLSHAEKTALLLLARNSIKARLLDDEVPSLSPDKQSVLSSHYGAFVTLKSGGLLRGCIGNIISPNTLWETVLDVAQASACEDTRFPPLSLQELDLCEIEISVLSVPVKISSIDEIRTGIHGIIVSDGYRRGLLLPQVPIEHGWDRESFLSHACRKAGLDGNCWKTRPLDIEIFSAYVFSEKSVMEHENE